MLGCSSAITPAHDNDMPPCIGSGKSGWANRQGGGEGVAYAMAGEAREGEGLMRLLHACPPPPIASYAGDDGGGSPHLWLPACLPG